MRNELSIVNRTSAGTLEKTPVARTLFLLECLAKVLRSWIQITVKGKLIIVGPFARLWFGWCQHFPTKWSSLGISESAWNVFFFTLIIILNLLPLQVLIFRQKGFIATTYGLWLRCLFVLYIHTHVYIHTYIYRMYMHTHTHLNIWILYLFKTDLISTDRYPNQKEVKFQFVQEGNQEMSVYWQTFIFQPLPPIPSCFSLPFLIPQAMNVSGIPGWSQALYITDTDLELLIFLLLPL